MEFYETLERRRSVRAFRVEDVSRSCLERILKAIVSCPTAGNLQAYRVHVFRDPKTKKALAKAAWDQRFIAEAPVVLVFSAFPSASGHKYGVRGRELYSLQDATIATTFAHLAAVAEGLGSCWVGAFDPEAASKAAALPASLIPVAILPIGHPRKVLSATSRLPFGELVRLEKD